MNDFDTRVLIISRKPNCPLVFLKRGGGTSSIATADCLFSREMAWEAVRLHAPFSAKDEVCVFKTVGVSVGIFGKTPDEICTAKQEALLRWCKSKQKTFKERPIYAKQKEKTTPFEESGSLFSNMA